ncbi:MAG: hypothetical protein H6660_15505 [Ardenticatenaceae bacterium]|nr:hypothetical protein [Ardenticatenaceae bacterium]
MKTHRGSLWRKWDLHIHTPASIEHWKGSQRYIDLENQSDKDVLTRHVIEAINQSDVDVFCIMDYWTFDGYFEIVDFLRRNPDVVCNSKIFPGIELRAEAPTKQRLNVHVIFSDKVTKQQLVEFKSDLRLLSTDRSLSNEALIDFAKTLDLGKASIHGATKAPSSMSNSELLTLGFRTAEIVRESLKGAVKRIPEGSCLIMLAYDTHGGAEELYWKEHPPADNEWMQLADLFEARSQENIDLFWGRETKKNQHFLNDFLTTIGGKPKPVISGSDAHSISDYGNFPSGKITWIKADPTFEGLKQVLIEPTQRSFIGSFPPARERVLNNKSHYISSLQVVKNEEYDKETWFEDVNIEFNHGLVAIIGNKGMGKSALADMVGLLGNSQREKYFSFLHQDKFRGRTASHSKAKHFKATLTWADESQVQKNLNENCSLDTPEAIRYVPQNFFDRICNEIELKKGGEFAQELDKIIFSHIEDFQRQGCLSLDDLINLKTREIERNIESLKSSLSNVNNDLEDIEAKLSPEYKQQILNEINQKQRDLDAIVQDPLAEVFAPDGSNETRQRLDSIRANREELSKKTEMVQEQQRIVEQKITAVDNLQESFAGFERDYKQWLKNSESNLTLLELDHQELISVTFSYIERFKDLKIDLQTAATTYSNDKKDIEKQQTLLNVQEAAIANGLETAERLYEIYKSDLEKRENRKKELQKEIEYRKDLIDKLKTETAAKKLSLETQRSEIVSNIFAQKVKLSEAYKSLYQPVRDLIENHYLIKNKYKLGFEVSIDVSLAFVERFLDFLNLTASGSYRGRDTGRERLNQKLSVTTFETAENVQEFLKRIVFSLRHNERNNDLPLAIESQLKNVSLSEFYDFLFGLDYLEPRYALTLDGKELPQLSPGERGILLLIFYLLIDKDDCPLIIDQPEENLDNQSVFELLVPCVEEAKNRRQIIIVTHNPNLAVVCNADQVIYSHIDKANKNRVRYISGSIENPEINDRIVDVLEGTWRAFNKREAMYQIIKR